VVKREHDYRLGKMQYNVGAASVGNQPLYTFLIRNLLFVSSLVAGKIDRRSDEGVQTEEVEASHSFGDLVGQTD